MPAKLEIVGWRRSPTPIRDPVTKFGGAPTWIEAPTWPVSPAWGGRPLMFLCQIELDPRVFPGGQGRMAYIFVTHPSSPDDDFFDPDIIRPDAGENAVVIQPSPVKPRNAEPLTEGPTLFDPEGLPYEALVDLKVGADPEFLPRREFGRQPDLDAYLDRIWGNKIGGTPFFKQRDEWPSPSGWQLLLQFDGICPFFINLGGAPTLLAFVSEDYERGTLLIQDS